MNTKSSKHIYSSILVVRLSSMGDVVITTPVLKNLRENYPQSKITYITREKYTPVLKNNPYLSKIVPLTDSDLTSLRYLKFCRRLNEIGFDLIVDLHNNPRSRILSLLVSHKDVIRVNKKRKIRTKMVYLKQREPELSMARLFLDTLEDIGISPHYYPPEIFIPGITQDSLKSNLKLHEHQKVVGLHPTAKWKSKEWGSKNYLRIAEELARKGHRVLFFGDGAPERDTSGISFYSNLSLETLIGYISICDLYIGNDTGPTHIAAALGVPVIAIFGPTHPSLGFKPTGKNTVITMHSDLDCSPCTFHGEEKCKYESYKCMEAITPEQVLMEAIKIIDKSKQD